MSRQVIFLHTELNPCQRILKPKFELDTLSEDSDDIYLQTKLETYLKRPIQVDSYPDLLMVALSSFILNVELMK